MFKSVSQLIRLFNIEEYGRVQGICIDMPTTSPSLILWCMDWDWGRIIANDTASAIAESKCYWMQQWTRTSEDCMGYCNTELSRSQGM